MEIREEKYLNKEAFVLENDHIKLVQLKDFGAKIASIVYKDKNREILFQPTNKKYIKPKFGENFSKYDTSGLDEMLPTIDACTHPKSGIILQDHGSLWSVPWTNRTFQYGIESEVVLEDLPLKFRRKVSIKEKTINLSYELFNCSEQTQYYLWALHGLMSFNNNTELFFPEEVSQVVNVIDNSKYDFNIKKLKEYPEKSQNKFYFNREVKEGVVGVRYKDDKFKLIMNYDSKLIKYLGVWVTKGGFKGEYNFAIEPCTGYYDTLERAYNNNKVSVIEAGNQIFWEINISFKDD